jgi:hypothetical protein
MKIRLALLDILYADSQSVRRRPTGMAKLITRRYNVVANTPKLERVVFVSEFNLTKYRRNVRRKCSCNEFSHVSHTYLQSSNSVIV